jgi:SAM-dependent methyltransferase
MVDECVRRWDSARSAPLRPSVTPGKLNFASGCMTDNSLFAPSSADLIWTRDVLLYLPVALKARAFDNFAHWLRPGGKFMIGDFGRAAGSLSSVCADYFASTSVHPITSDAYVQLLESSGRLVVEVQEDLTELFVELNQRDLAHFEAREQEFKVLHPGSYFDELRERWRTKIAAASDGSLQWQRLLGRRL